MGDASRSTFLVECPNLHGVIDILGVTDVFDVVVAVIFVECCAETHAR